MRMMMNLFGKKRCEKCYSFLLAGKYTGMCTNLSVVPKNTALILDSFNVIRHLNWKDQMPPVHRVIVSKNFGCIYWEKK